MDGWYGRIFSGAGFDMDKPIAEVHQEGAARPALQGADEDQGRGHQPHLRGPDPEDPEVDALQGRRRDAAAHPGVRASGRSPSSLPGLRRHPAQPARPGPSKIDGARASPSLRDADQRPGRVGPRRSTSRRSARCSKGLQHLLDSFDEIGLGYLSPRPAGRHAVRRRGAAHQDDPPPRLLAHRRHLRVRRADDRAAPPRHRADERAAAPAAGQGQHRARRRAQARDHRDRRPRRRPRPRRRHRGRRGGLRGHRRGAAGERHHHRPPPRRPRRAQGVGADADGALEVRGADDAQPPRRRRRHPARGAVRRHRRRRLGQELADPRLGRGPRRRRGRSTRARSGARGAATRRRTPACSTRSARRSRRPTA